MMSEREAAKAMREAAEYLDAIELEMIRNNADMSLDAMMPPSAVAHNLRDAIRALPLPDPSPAPASDDATVAELSAFADKLIKSTVASIREHTKNRIAAVNQLVAHDDPASAMGDEEIRQRAARAIAGSLAHAIARGKELDNAAFDAAADAVLAVASPILTQRARDKALDDAAALFRDRCKLGLAGHLVVADILSLKGTPHV